MNSHIISTPLITDALSHLRNKETNTKNFRHYSDIICSELLRHSFLETDLQKRSIETPVREIIVSVITGNFIVIPILRAGLAMLPSALSLFPSAKVGIVGLARDEETAIASEYYWHVPEITSEDTIIITDPMLATGGSILHVLKKLSDEKPKEIRVVSVIAAPEGVAAVTNRVPQVSIITAAIDEKLNDKKYIVPGLGDYGDRYFGN